MSKEQIKHTIGPINVTNYGDGQYSLYKSNDGYVEIEISTEEDNANAMLIKDAFDTATDTGLTPSQLRDERFKLAAAYHDERKENKGLKEQKDDIELKYNALLLDFGIMVDQRDELLKRIKELESVMKEVNISLRNGGYDPVKDELGRMYRKTEKILYTKQD